MANVTELSLFLLRFPLTDSFLNISPQSQSAVKIRLVAGEIVTHLISGEELNVRNKP